MPQFDVTVPHGQSKDDAHERLKSFSEKVKEHYADMVKDVEQQWEGDTLHFGFKTMGVGIKGDLVVNENDVRVRGDLPFTAMMFKGKIESALRDEITRLLG
ncbi:putative polyhydroxyalkanoic acid system protein (PHA_gran_rgn) [Posidoniimonas corsicana]|uniref:Putative polyhydroxyalkanoic acid system protein (PHA_gran_rgn) n=1 Tax=Posidoniimonas corsicana TaxID=1938618 RepID=A0A5C5V089_9BACT|nr:polyhydroxyalkanoic acid system family protein [Posidoniimonas corsicana]TWT31135.1 putative polyhydroxyalkanoic acid system protein (PHA_gran_rgn) [Posidoniimonas corsicana]